jgi:hypothetical protein
MIPPVRHTTLTGTNNTTNRRRTMIEIADTTTGNVLQAMTVDSFLKNLVSRWHDGSVQQAIVDFNASMISVYARLA